MDEFDGEVGKKVGLCDRIRVKRKVIEVRWGLAVKKSEKTSWLIL